MSQRRAPLLAVLLALPVLVGCPKPAAPPTAAPTPAPRPTALAAGWTLTSPAFNDGDKLPAAHTADAKNVSPSLAWTTPPESTVELALIVDDPDAPTGPFTHWVLYGLPPTTTQLPQGVPTKRTLDNLGGARQGENDFDAIGYRGPAPPPGKVHHYQFTLYALDRKLDLQPGASRLEVDRAMKGHVLATAMLTATYQR
jgi:hypothetical protein